MKKRIAIWNFNYMPEWEAASKEAQFLFTELGDEFETSLVAMNTRRRKMKFSGREKHFPLPFALVMLPLLKGFARRFDLHHIYASLSEHFLLPRLKGPRTLLTASKDHPDPESVIRNLPLLKELPMIVVESEWHRNLLLENGMAADRVRLVYPGKSVHPYRKPEGPFTVLFATSPRTRGDFEARGVSLLLEVAGRMPEVRFVLVWRDLFLGLLEQRIREKGLANVEVRNGAIRDMAALYDAAHTVVLPGLTANSIKPCPHSALDALSHGKPILVSEPLSLAGIVRDRKCGLVFTPETDALEEAIRSLENGYDAFQAPCHEVVQDTFSPDGFLEAYREIYRTLGA